jgi:6,7-dimethyl-8-ribityllumazine synthase
MEYNPPHILVVDARFYAEIGDELVRGATAALEDGRATYERLSVPGAFEIPAAIKYAVRSLDFEPERRRFDGYVALGCVIRGETSHFDYVCRESARALQGLVCDHALAMGYGILTVENADQAWERAAVDGRDKGGSAVRVCLAMIELKHKFGLYPR